MNEYTKNTNTRSDQQTLTQAAEALQRQNSQPEIIFRIEPDGRYLRWANDVDQSLSLMVNYSDAERVQKNRDAFDNLLPARHTLTVTGTEDDSVVIDRNRWSVVDFLAEFERRIRYIPDWCWVTGNMSERRQNKAIDRYVERVEWFHTQIEDMGLPVEIQPLAKGLNGKHFQRFVDDYNRLNIDEIAIYGVQTPSLDELVTRVEQAIAVLNPKSMLVIGRGEPHEVAQFPKRVDAIASWRSWMRACNFTADDYSDKGLQMWINENERAVQQGHKIVQTGLEGYFKEEVKADG